MIYPFKRKNEMLFDPFVVPSTDPRSPIVCLPSRCVFVFRKEQFQIGIERMRSLFVFLFIVFHLLKIAKFVAHARLSQYVNPAKQLPCLCLSPSLTGQVHISPFLQKNSSVYPIEPLPSQVWPQRSPQSRWNPFILTLFAPPSV